jgi:hypothetical protein
MSVPLGRWRVPGHIRCLLSHLCRRAGKRRSKLASGDRVIHPDKPLVGPNHQNQLDRRISWTGQDNQPFNKRTLQEIAKPVQVADKSGSGQGIDRACLTARVTSEILPDSWIPSGFRRTPLGIVAERQGFEPWVRFHAHTLSKRAP